MTTHKIRAAAVALILTASASANPPAKIPLRNTAIVQNNSIRLSDLLPANAAVPLRTAAEKITIAKSPEPGVTRKITAEQIAAAIQNATLAAELQIPQSITIKRWSRYLTPNEIAAAIQKSFPSASLAPADISIDSPIEVAEENPTLTVMRTEPRAGTTPTQTHVALWIASEPHRPPFWATVNAQLDLPNATLSEPHEALADTPPNSKPLAAQTTLTSRATPNAHIRNGAAPPRAVAMPPLIHAGAEVELIVQGANMRISTKATALETGREGDQIRVQCAAAPQSGGQRGRILIAKVVAPQIAEIDY
jgi:flagellar basal body P-ring formation chaperone FlgA